MNDPLTIHVQIEIQQMGLTWYVKGCTAYASDGTKWPITVSDQRFCSRGAAIKAMKQKARQDLSPSDHLLWQLVLWFPDKPISLSGHADNNIVHHPDEPAIECCLVEELAPTI